MGDEGDFWKAVKAAKKQAGVKTLSQLAKVPPCPCMFCGEIVVNPCLDREEAWDECNLAPGLGPEGDA